jgi:hypothetical protein
VTVFEPYRPVESWRSSGLCRIIMQDYLDTPLLTYNNNNNPIRNQRHDRKSRLPDNSGKGYRLGKASRERSPATLSLCRSRSRSRSRSRRISASPLPFALPARLLYVVCLLYGTCSLYAHCALEQGGVRAPASMSRAPRGEVPLLGGSPPEGHGDELDAGPWSRSAPPGVRP